MSLPSSTRNPFSFLNPLSTLSYSPLPYTLQTLTRHLILGNNQQYNDTERQTLKHKTSTKRQIHRPPLRFAAGRPASQRLSIVTAAAQKRRRSCHDEENEANKHIVTSPTIIRPVQRQRQRHTAKAYFIVQEIINTERSYVSHLQTLNKAANICIQHTKQKQTAKQVFGNIRDILAINTELLANLERIQSTDKSYDYDALADIFARLAPFLKIYAVFAANYTSGVRAYRSLPPSVMQVLPDISVMITPIQRLPRYKLLLEALLKETLHPNPILITALEKIEQSADHVNEAIRAAEAAESFAEQYKTFIEPGRTLIRTGSLNHPIALFTDMIVFRNWRGKLESIDLLKVAIDEKTLEGPSFSMIIDTDKPWSFDLTAKNIAEKYEWVSAIHTAKAALIFAKASIAGLKE